MEVRASSTPRYFNNFSFLPPTTTRTYGDTQRTMGSKRTLPWLITSSSDDELDTSSPVSKRPRSSQPVASSSQSSNNRSQPIVIDDDSESEEVEEETSSTPQTPDLDLVSLGFMGFDTSCVGTHRRDKNSWGTILSRDRDFGRESPLDT